MSAKNIATMYRLSPAQEGILYHTLESAKAGVYFEQYTSTLAQSLNPERFAQAWRIVTTRHDAMRSMVIWEGREKPLQIVRERVELPWDEYDWRDLDAADQAAQWESVVQRDRDRGFDFSRAPMMRFTLARTGEDHYRFMWSFHHLLLDGWSMRLVLEQVAEVYLELSGADPKTAHAAPSFATFISWLERQDIAAARTHWSKVLRGFSNPTNPMAVSSPQRSDLDGVSGLRTLALDTDERVALEDFARSERITLNTLVIGAWATVMGRYTDSADVVFGTTVSGRPAELPESDSIVGMFINTLPMRVQSTDTMVLGDWLRDIQTQQLEMRRFAHTPLVEVQRCSDVVPGIPLFETIVVFENFPTSIAAKSTERLNFSDESYAEYSHYPLALLVVPGESIDLIAVHDSKQYSTKMIEAMLVQLRQVLRAFASRDHGNSNSVSIFPPPDFEEIVRSWNDTTSPFPLDRMVHELISACARKDPDTTAIVDGGGQITYGELEQRAATLANRLREMGVNKDTYVPIYAERCIDAVVAMLAVLRAGGAYVPLDADYPPGRTASLLADVHASVAAETSEAPTALLVLTQRKLIDKIPKGHEVLCVDDPDRSPNSRGIEEQAGDELHQVEPQDLAYVMYTSGSTGGPKGVMVTHANLLNSCFARFDYYPEIPHSFLLLSSIATDSSVAGIYWALCNGRTLVLPPARIEQDIVRLSTLISDQKVSLLLCLPTLWSAILESADLQLLATLKSVIVAGEACTSDTVKNHFEALPRVSLYNEYGPTEATVWATVSELAEVNVQQGITIGRPIANTSIYILDSALRPAPIGVPGEIHIGGASVARGYLNNVEQTNAKFVANPIDGSRDGVLYKTGDLGRFNSNGTIDFLGRVDDQIKVRGFRIEPGEIEAALRLYPGVTEAIIVPEQGDSLNDYAHAKFNADADTLAQDLAALGPNDAEDLLTEIENLSAGDIQLRLSGVTGTPGNGTIGSKRG